MKIVVLDGLGLNPGDLDWHILDQFGEVVVYDATPYDDKDEIIKRLAGADVALVNKVPITSDIIDASPDLKAIAETATGYDNIDVDYAKTKHIAVMNVPTYGTDAVAQFTFALLLAVTSRVKQHDDLVHEGEWAKAGRFSFWDAPLMELKGKTLGLVGFGKIAQAVAKIALAFNMRVIFYNHQPKEVFDEAIKQVDLKTLYAESDIISLHVPFTPEMSEFINTDTLGQMKDTAILINTARGKLINDADLAAALNSGQIAYAALDVATQEPISDNSPLLTAKHCYLTPHIAWAPLETRQRLLDIVVANIQGYLNNDPQNVVNS
ncbi:D-2-hydroxyacid dehydrogenase [Weissella paramesenteroides]|uniref:D-2-hydroxyacid dehydrogenase n=1 Tax=Weissella paramesenteroides TaxID=1249 RepID=UPI0018DA70AD|nr:D-2-hydroxyacid dehydrogenase [Weissella paramesenteroides]QPI46369.1 D-2-hydroxyacid dehydrogenase [Weissella paramesenteroides]